MYQMDNLYWTFRPFLFVNLAVLPEDMKAGETLLENLKSNTVASAGFGMQLIHSLV